MRTKKDTMRQERENTSDKLQLHLHLIGYRCGANFLNQPQSQVETQLKIAVHKVTYSKCSFPRISCQHFNLYSTL